MSSQNIYKNIMVILGVVSLGFFVAYYFAYQDIKEKNKSIAVLAQELDLESSRQEYLVSTQRMIKNISSDIDRINNSIISVDGNVSFIEGLEAVAKSNGLSITIDSLVIEDDPTFSESGITTLKIKAKTKGSWAGTYTFISQIESLPYKIKVSQFGMQGSASELVSGKKVPVSEWQSSFEIRVLKYK